jgi:hypothetical protein
MELFGFQITRKKDEEEIQNRKSFTPPETDDGTTVISEGGYYGQYVDIEGTKAKDDTELIKKYREISLYPECDSAVEDIVNEAIVSDHEDQAVEIVVDNLEGYSDKIKKLIRAEFDNVTKLLNFGTNGHDIFRKWYIDGRVYYHMIVDEKNPKNGIVEMRPIDSLRIRKVRQVIEDKDPRTGAKMIKGYNEFYIYQDQAQSKANTGLKINKDAIIYVPSGVVDQNNKKVLSYLYKAIKPVNQLRMMEDSLVIYRLARAPERRIFYIDVGNLPKGKAEGYLRDIMSRYKNKIVYDANTGEIKDDRKHMAMLEDFWLPRREGGKGTEITTLPGGENLGQIEDILYFQKKLYKSLNVPVSRLEENQSFVLGRSTEISRDEVKFTKFIGRLRKKFSELFMQTLRAQLILKGIITKDDWDNMKEDLVIDFLKDNYFAELKEGELLRERMNTLGLVDPYVGKYYSKEWIRRHVLQQTEEDMEEIDEQIAAEEETVQGLPPGAEGDGQGDQLAQADQGADQQPDQSQESDVLPAYQGL